jgi:hypothetical protein
VKKQLLIKVCVLGNEVDRVAVDYLFDFLDIIFFFVIFLVKLLCRFVFFDPGFFRDVSFDLMYVGELRLGILLAFFVYVTIDLLLEASIEFKFLLRLRICLVTAVWINQIVVSFLLLFVVLALHLPSC